MNVHRGGKAGNLALVLALLLVPAVATAEEDSELRGLEVGFLAGVFAVFRDAGLSVDQVATSETTTTRASWNPWAAFRLKSILF